MFTLENTSKIKLNLWKKKYIYVCEEFDQAWNF